MSYSDIIVKHYESCLEKHGDGCRAVDWPNEEDAVRRYIVMLDIRRIFNNECSILDFGCGIGALYGIIIFLGNINYTGYDASAKMIEAAKFKYKQGIWTTELPNERYDYVIMNGVFTEKITLTYEQAWDNMTETLLKAWPLTRKGLAFNIMSKNVTHERDDLFHVSMDTLTRWVCENLSRHFIIRADYGLYEYTVYVYRNKS